MGGDMLSIAAGALSVYQSEIAVISNDVANVGTTAFKAQTMLVQSAFYDPLHAATSPTSTNGGSDPIQEGNGVKVGSMSTDQTQGAFQTTGISTNLAIDGTGYFVMNTLGSDGTPQYTRDGNFSINQDGYLVNAATGMVVQGYQASPAGAITPNGALTSLNVPVGQVSQAIGTGFGAKTGPSASDSVFDMLASGNLDQSQWVTAANGGVSTPQVTTTTVYDSLGGAHQLTLTYSPVVNTSLPSVKNASGTAIQAATEWQVSASFADGTQVSNGTTTGSSATVGYVYFDANGQFINTSADSVAGSTVHTLGATPSTAAGDVLDVTSWGSNNNATAPTANGSTGSTAKTGAIGIGFSNLTSLSGAGEAVTTLSQNGFPQGELSSVQIGKDGKITGSFSNGLQKTLGQVALATFENPQGLVAGQANMYTSSVNTGLAQIGTAGSGPFGTISSDSLEQSNVSIATEFSKLIVAQNAYIANSKSITIGNQDLQAIDQLIQ